MRLIVAHLNVAHLDSSLPVRICGNKRFNGFPDRSGRKFDRAVRCGQKRELRTLVVDVVQIIRDRLSLEAAVRQERHARIVAELRYGFSKQR